MDTPRGATAVGDVTPAESTHQGDPGRQNVTRGPRPATAYAREEETRRRTRSGSGDIVARPGVTVGYRGRAHIRGVVMTAPGLPGSGPPPGPDQLKFDDRSREPSTT